MARVDKVAVFDALDAIGTETVCRRLGVELRGRGAQRRAKVCPACGERGGWSVVVTMASGLWHCKPHGCGGSAFDLAAFTLGCDPRRDFAAALEEVARFADVSPEELTTEERMRREKERTRREAEGRERTEQQERARIAAAWGLASAAMAEATVTHSRGMAYLEQERGLRGYTERGVVVYFDRDGNIAVPLFGLDGKPINVVRRLLPPHGETKVLGLKGCPGVGYFGAPVEWLDQIRGHVFITEGLLDYLTASYLLHDHSNRAYGAHGASNIPRLVAFLAPLVAARRLRFCYVVHEDQAGGDNVERAIEAAMAAGVPFDPEIDLFNLGGASDLNEALCKETGDVRDYL